MNIWTFAEVAQKIKADLDLQEETFISPDELLGYVNEGIHEAESEILKINEDYFLTNIGLAITTGDTEVDLPADIYAQKIRGFLYSSGSIQYPIRRIRGENKFDILQMISTYGQNDDYRYFPFNGIPGKQTKILMAPASRETTVATDGIFTLWYIRSAQRVPTAAEIGQQPTDSYTIAQLNTAVDIPEFASFIIDFAKCKCLQKDTDPRFSDQVQVMERQRKMMVDSLTVQVPDDDDTILPDMDFYRWTS